jgi:hypothetical protein
MNFPLDLVKYCRLEGGSLMVSDGWGKKNGIRIKIELFKENE